MDGKKGCVWVVRLGFSFLWLSNRPTTINHQKDKKKGRDETHTQFIKIINILNCLPPPSFLLLPR